ncbi:MAG TPA: glycosyltransferase family 2 protein [Bacteroidia bacterium]|jgi:glycosyltransferase involved in cell wall biosynthesis|nr:glycosyltransferase family 2 protein [Bacteroidota bacterium]MBP9790472.1 glycosyltransferase family 2 protein [Bacteroidia bacterium]MBK8586118.1 glycosyltransferase family 2 protein [Bacteroidota bacterium]MBP9923361.1 glycosyltransferase family 2 protein [Bacteroidia bacterium]HQW00492.1 glycosyltransferase family 2 protein [Bacteroidia bacterium]
MKLSIIIPLYNEQDLVLKVLDELQSVNYPAFLEGYEIIVVDDCSKDQSYERVNEYISKSPNRQFIKLFRHDVNSGKGAAVRTGAGKASGDVLLIQDSDLELTPKDIPSMLIAKKELEVPFINGSRYIPGVIRPQSSFKRYFFNKLFTLIASIFIDVHITDVACGYKLFDKSLFEKLNLRENRFGFEAELILKCGRFQRNWIAEVPVRYFPRNLGEGKKLRNIDGFRIFMTLMKYGLFRMK